jgi:undecaprenyl-diphosphatase
MNILQAVIMGVVEGLTEFLPVSSTAHLTLTADLLNIAHSEYTKSFEIIIQFGAILAVVWLYWRKFLELEIIKKLALAFIPTGILGLVFYKVVKQYLLGNTAVVLWALAIGGVALILLELFFFGKRVAENTETRLEDITYKQCVTLGLFQAIAMVPGVSRSAATIVGGMLLRIPRRVIVEFSFLLAVPTMAAATGLDLAQSAGTWNSAEIWTLAVGFVVSFFTAIVSIRWLLRYVEGHRFVSFGVYRVILVLAFLIFF